MSEESKLRQLSERALRYKLRSDRREETLSVETNCSTSHSNDLADDSDSVFTEPDTQIESLNLEREERLRPNLKLYLPERPNKTRPGSPNVRRHRENLTRHISLSDSPIVETKQYVPSPLTERLSRMVAALQGCESSVAQLHSESLSSVEAGKLLVKKTLNHTTQTQSDLNSLQVQTNLPSLIAMPGSNPPTNLGSGAGASVENRDNRGNGAGGSGDDGSHADDESHLETSLDTTHRRRAKAIIDLKAIPYFDGTGNVARFIDIAQAVMNRQSTDEERDSWLEALRTKLDGTAYDIGKSASTWQTLKKDLRDRFMPVQSVEDVESKIIGMRFLRNVESIEDYLDRVTKLGNRYRDVLMLTHNVSEDVARSMADYKMMRHFINGLDEPIKTTMVYESDGNTISKGSCG